MYLKCSRIARERGKKSPTNCGRGVVLGSNYEFYLFVRLCNFTLLQVINGTYELDEVTSDDDDDAVFLRQCT